MTIATIDPMRLWCPYDYRRNALVSVEDVELQLHAWAEKYGLLSDPVIAERFGGARFGECAALVYPDAPDLLVYAKWLTWLFIADDEFDENRAPTAGGIDGGVLDYLPLDGPALKIPTTPVTAALVDLWRELAPAMPRLLRERFRTHVDQYARSYGSALAQSRTDEAPDLGPYVALRRSSGAVETCMDLIERQPGAYLIPLIAGADPVLALRAAANDIICWTNDVLSIAKEIRHGEMNNLVAVLRGAIGMDWQAALEAATEMNAVRTREFDRNQRLLLASNEFFALSNFIDGLKLWISGSLRWHLGSPRYADSLSS
ncbi:hypothetical protein [Streptomyces sp. NPDC017991]|uniref:terpene synthase family protein n=1 Tax=Streptomyces sp. NPDC017991 TaxID=3365026 RepID=UPI0037891D0C